MGTIWFPDLAHYNIYCPVSKTDPNPCHIKKEKGVPNQKKKIIDGNCPWGNPDIVVTNYFKTTVLHAQRTKENHGQRTKANQEKMMYGQNKSKEI